MRRELTWLLAVILVGLLLALVHLVPVPVEPYLDFQVIYHANMGLLRGIPLYDRAGQANMIADLAGVEPEEVFVLPFPYPPWYALATLPLTYFSIAKAAQLWMTLNLAMILLSIWLLTDGWPLRRKLIAMMAGLFFVPTLGALYVGQYVFPVLLGSALVRYALCHEKPLLVACAAMLLTFKPHLGGLMLVATLVYLFISDWRGSFGRSALLVSGLSGLALFALGFLADRNWPHQYLQSLTEFRRISGVDSCNLCISLPTELVRWFGGEGIGSAFWISVFFLVALVSGILWKRSVVWKSPVELVAMFALVTLLVSPYLLNYDFVLLIVPLLTLAGMSKPYRDWVILSFAWGLPWLGFGLFGRQGNLSLLLSAIILMIGIIFKPLNPIKLDLPRS